MTRLEKIRAMTVREIAEILIKDNAYAEEYCKSDCEEEECLHELECCIKWLKEDVGE